jgi:AcrR family transcriptional regulator
MYAIIFDYSQITSRNIMSTTETVPQELSRVERKRLLARTRIIDAARELMTNGHIEDVTIQDITSAADVGHGTFYLHFKSKHEVLLPIMVAEAAAMDARLQVALQDVSDPAEFFGLSSRFMGYSIVRNDLWRWFLTHSGLPSEDMRKAFGSFSNRDIEAGLASGRLQVTDRHMAAVFGFGGFVSVLLASLDAEDPEALIDGATETLLRVFGVDPIEASRIAHLSIQHIK